MAKKTLGVNPWTHIWIKPRETLKKVVRFNPKYRFVILSFIYGLPMLLHMAQNLSVGEQFNIIGIVIVALVLATFVGMLGLTIASALVYWTGKWIGGKANYFPVRAAVSWSNVPNIFAIIIWAILIYNFRDHIFLSEFDEMNFVGGQMTLITGALFVQAAIAIWSFIILVKGLGEVQGFSAWKGVLNVLIPFFMIGILIWVITWLFWACNGMPGA
ncbi:MAG: hypothetical protein K940chlam6_01204 [Chlamydiae bacterium]|nr:hypothetical protein [Chlamydiota bacterium]